MNFFGTSITSQQQPFEVAVLLLSILPLGWLQWRKANNLPVVPRHVWGHGHISESWGSSLMFCVRVSHHDHQTGLDVSTVSRYVLNDVFCIFNRYQTIDQDYIHYRFIKQSKPFLSVVPTKSNAYAKQ